MKNYKNAVPLALVIFMGIGIYVNVDNAVEEQKEVEKCLAEARKYAEMEIYDDALASYDSARAIDDSLEINLEEGRMLVTSGRISDAVSWGEEMKSKFPRESAVYDFLLEQYIAEEDYTKAFDLYDAICSIGVINDSIKKQMQEIEYAYSFGYDYYDDVDIFSRGFAAVCKEEKWGYVNETGDSVIPCQFAEAGVFADYAAVCDSDGEWYYISQEGNKKFIVKNLKNCSYLGIYTDDVLVAKSDAGYGYYTMDFECIADSFLNAVAINGGVGAAQNDKGWYLVGPDGKHLLKTYFDEVAIDEKRICYRNDRVFVRDNLYYKMLDAEGNEIPVDGKITNVKIFAEADGLAAVEINGKWGFINKDGEIVIEPQYMDARASSNGYAAVCNNNKWGYITQDGTMVIDFCFDGAMDFNASGCAFVCENGSWRLMKLYKDNH